MQLCRKKFERNLEKKAECIRVAFRFDAERGPDQLVGDLARLDAYLAFGEMSMCSKLKHIVPLQEDLSASLLTQELLLIAESRIERYDFDPCRGINQLKGDLAKPEALFAYAESQLCKNLINWIEVGALLRH